jgi:HNH endonuclease
VSAYIPVELQRRVRDRFQNCCAYCHTAEALIAMTFEFEHITPRSAGGETVFENLGLACPHCNRHKADRQMAVVPGTARQVPLFHPQVQLWAEHFAWSEDATELVGLSEIGLATIATLRMNRAQLVKARGLWARAGEHPPLI